MEFNIKMVEIKREDSNIIDSKDTLRTEFNIVFYDDEIEIGRYDFDEIGGSILTSQEIMLVLRGMVKDIYNLKKELGLL